MTDTSQVPSPILPALAKKLDPTGDTSKWAYDPTYEATVNNINKGLAGLQSTSDLESKRVNENYDTSADRLAKANTMSNDQLQERMANQGIQRSGINVNEQGKLADTYQQNISDLGTTKTRSLEDIVRTQATRKNEYDNQLSQAQADRAGREGDRETKQAADDSLAVTNAQTADTQRQWMSDLQTKLIGMTQPVATPTGQMKLPDPNASVQQALQQVPPPAATTPQQQAQDNGIDPKQLQNLLRATGNDPGPTDGIIGNKTQKALASWKQSVGLPANADINPDVFQSLYASANRGM